MMFIAPFSHELKRPSRREDEIIISKHSLTLGNMSKIVTVKYDRNRFGWLACSISRFQDNLKIRKEKENIPEYGKKSA